MNNIKIGNVDRRILNLLLSKDLTIEQFKSKFSRVPHLQLKNLENKKLIIKYRYKINRYAITSLGINTIKIDNWNRSVKGKRLNNQMNKLKVISNKYRVLEDKGRDIGRMSARSVISEERERYDKQRSDIKIKLREIDNERILLLKKILESSVDSPAEWYIFDNVSKISETRYYCDSEPFIREWYNKNSGRILRSRARKTHKRRVLTTDPRRVRGYMEKEIKRLEEKQEELERLAKAFEGYSKEEHEEWKESDVKKWKESGLYIAKSNRKRVKVLEKEKIEIVKDYEKFLVKDAKERKLREIGDI